MNLETNQWFDNYKTFEGKDWKLKTSEEGLDYKDYNDRWNTRRSYWFSTIDWLSSSSNTLFHPDCSIWQRYLTLFYYSLINLGTGELSPTNSEELVWFNMSLLISTLMFSIFFSNITSLLLELNFDSMRRQQILDQANGVMNAIRYSQEAQDEVRMYFAFNYNSQEFQNVFDCLLSDLPPSC